MIGYLKGRLFDFSDGKALLYVGGFEGGLGYCITLPQSQSYQNLLVGNILEVYVYTHVREDAFDLYGFCSPLEKEVFLTLLSVSSRSLISI